MDYHNGTAKVDVYNQAPNSGRKRRRSREESLISAVTSSIEDSLTAERLAKRTGILQSLDPRIKVVSIFLLIIAVAFSSQIPVLAGFYILALLLAGVSLITPVELWRRTWVVPVMTLVIALPALFITTGTPLITLLHFNAPASIGPVSLPESLTITEQGARSAALLILRVTSSATLAILLVLTTEWTKLLKGIRSIGVPKMFVVIIGMTHRYIFLLLHTVSNMFLSRRSRTVGSLSRADGRRWLMDVSGLLVGKSYHMSNEVYLAMLSRGYRGEPVTMERFRLQATDFLLLGLAIAITAATILVSYL